MSNENAPPAQVHRVEVVPVAPPATAPRSDGLEFRDMSADQFKERLEREREKGARDLLKELGVDSKKDRRAALKEISEGRLQLSKKEQEAADAKAKADAEAAKLKPLEEKLKAKDEVLKRYADAEFAKLPENVQKAIAERFADDSQARLDGIEWMRKHGLLPTAAVPAAGAAATTEPAKPPAPATTIATPGPAPTPPVGAQTAQQQYDALMRAGKTVAAASFASLHNDLDRRHPDRR